MAAPDKGDVSDSSAAVDNEDASDSSDEPSTDNVGAADVSFPAVASEDPAYH